MSIFDDTSEFFNFNEFNAAKAAMKFSFYAPDAAWSVFRAGGTQISLVLDMFPDVDTTVTHLVPALAMSDTIWRAFEVGGWDLTRLHTFLTDAVSMQSTPMQEVVRNATVKQTQYLARDLKVSTRDPQLELIEKFIKLMCSFWAYWDVDTTGFLAAMAPYWFEICDAARGLTVAQAVAS